MKNFFCIFYRFFFRSRSLMTSKWHHLQVAWFIKVFRLLGCNKNAFAELIIFRSKSLKSADQNVKKLYLLNCFIFLQTGRDVWDPYWPYGDWFVVGKLQSTYAHLRCCFWLRKDWLIRFFSDKLKDQIWEIGWDLRLC